MTMTHSYLLHDIPWRKRLSTADTGPGGLFAGVLAVFLTGLGIFPRGVRSNQESIFAMSAVQALGVDHPPTSKESKSSLHKAAHAGSLMGLKRALATGNTMDGLDGRGWTALHYVAFDGNVEAVTWLLAHGADVNRRSFDGDTPLHIAMEDVVEELIHWGADVNACNREARTPLLDHAGSTWQVLDILLRHGAALRTVDVYGRTPLHGVQSEGARMLLNLGADVNARDINGWTPLHQALYDRRLEVAEILINAGADRRAEDVRGRTPCDMIRPGDREYAMQQMNKENRE